jgi:3',5'-cyclic AMP phosphodiesterase CpdA
MTEVVRLIHFSDIHITSRPLGWRRRDFASKRFTGLMNMRLLGRGRRFRHANDVAQVLMAEVRERRPDHLIFSGDATALAFEPEFMAASDLLGVRENGMPPGLAIPGNHDCYVKHAVHDRLFERYFEPWQSGVRVDSETYPFAQKVGPVWLVAVNSSTYNFWTWDATGQVGSAQRDRLRELLKTLPHGPRILVTHYPLSRHNGLPERRWHGLRDSKEMVRVAADGGVSLWLHGHIHRPFILSKPHSAPFPIICAGSATQSQIWVYNEYTITGGLLTVVRRVFSPLAQSYQDKDIIELDLK